MSFLSSSPYYKDFVNAFYTEFQLLIMYSNKFSSTLALFFICTLGYAQIVNNSAQLNDAIISAGRIEILDH